MKTTIKLLFLLFLLLQGCDKKDDNIEFTSAALYQTRWKGTMVMENLKSSAYLDKLEVGITFISENRGGYSFFYKPAKYVKESSFTYEIKGKVLWITGEAYRFGGNWFIISFKDKEMVLEQGTGGEGAYKSTLRLRKI